MAARGRQINEAEEHIAAAEKCESSGVEIYFPSSISEAIASEMDDINIYIKHADTHPHQDGEVNRRMHSKHIIHNILKLLTEDDLVKVKTLKTGFLKWKPDYDGAASEFVKAATCYKNGRAHEEAIRMFMKAADMQVEIKALFHAAKSLEQAGLLYRDQKDFVRAADLFDRAGELYLESGTSDTAALCLEKAGKILEKDLPERAIKCYTRAADICDTEDRPRQAAESIGKVARLQLKLKRMDEAGQYLKKEVEFLALAENYANAYKVVIASVLVQLTRGDFVMADNIYKHALAYPGFSDSEDAASIGELLTAYDEEDGDAMNSILSRPLFRYMENEFVKLSRDLMTAFKNSGGEQNQQNHVSNAADDEVEDLK